ncbi:hypothetical protein ACFT2C_10360 [Promicromonospora sp. NPDC057138]|uniref:hypothetical protein n=1 Tax=Promicromonospora sp. NPDC057138 TaxID=3346031 RepID=UPI0036429A6D
MDAESGTPTGGEASSPYFVRPAGEPARDMPSPAGPPEDPGRSGGVRTERPPADLLAVLLGNATLLGLGYAFLRRWGLFATALAGTVVLVGILAAVPGSPGWLIVLGVWWLAMVAHGWWLARPGRVAPAERPLPQRIVAGAVVVALVATVVGLRIDTVRTVDDAAVVHAAGDCDQATELLDRLGPANRVVYGSMALKGEADLEACGLLLDALAPGQQDREAAAELQVYMNDPSALWDGAGPLRAEHLLDTAYDDGAVDQKALEAGFEQLATTLDETPSQAGRVESVAKAFLADLAEQPDHCAVRDVVEWVDGQGWEAPALAEPVAAASDEVPRRILGCARTLADADELTASRHTYEAFLHDFRSDRRADAASDELYDVITGIQRKNVQDLLTADRYCANPAPYRGAAPYRRSGGNPMRVYGIDPIAHAFPRPWRANSLDDMVLVACVDGPKDGSYQETCAYESDIGGPFGSDVDFYASRFDVKLYEVRTGRQVAAFSDEFGEPCPPSIMVESYTGIFVPPDTKRSTFTSGDLRGMFEVYQS